ncbi:T9SS type A sorting domain-containing protein, partial [candidate division WOR-3 bacterium]|nr:T9SS type A sorting domain-containing protein [candidate division WOR-3 bacterium]
LTDATVRLYKSATGMAGPGAEPLHWADIGPSPFRDRLSVQLGARSPADLNVRILDRAGRVVRQFSAPAGGQQLVWNGTDQAGRMVNPGVYFCQASGGGKTVTKSVIYLGAR